jgi:glutamyl-tRNA reductase
VLTRAGVLEVMRPRRQRPLFIIDIALPRDVEPSVGDLEQVFLYNIDDLQGIVKENLTRRSGELERAEAIVDEEVERFTIWLQSREIIPTVVALRDRFETIRQSELARLEPKLAGLPPEARARVDEITQLLVQKLLLTPTEQLKSVRDESLISSYSDALQRLFALESDQPDRSETPRKPRITALRRE